MSVRSTGVAAPLPTAPYIVVAASGSAQTLSVSKAGYDTIYDVTETANCTYTLAAGQAVAGRLQTIRLRRRQDSVGGRVCALPPVTAVNYPSAFVPAVSSAYGTVDIFDFATIDGGITWDCVGYSTSLTKQAITLAAFVQGPYYSSNTFSLSGAFAGPTPTAVDYSFDGGSTWATATTTSITANAYIVSGTLPNTGIGVKSVMVRETNAQAAFSASQSLTIAAPVAPATPNPYVAGASSTSTYIANLTPPQANGSPITGYTIYRGTTAGGESAMPIVTNVALPYSDTGLTTGTTYYYTVAAVNAVGTGSPSAEVFATPTALTDPGKGYFLTEDIGTLGTGNPPTTAAWGQFTFNGGIGLATITAHNTVADPAGNLTASTVHVPAQPTTAAQIALGCQTSGQGTVSRTYTFYAKGHVGGELMNFFVETAAFASAGPATNIALTTSWQKFSVTYTAPSTANMMFVLRVTGQTTAVDFDFCWANVA